MTYRGLVIEKGLLECREADGQIFIGDAAGKPSQLALAGGIVRLGGRLDLRSDVPHYVIDQPLVVVEKAAPRRRRASRTTSSTPARSSARPRSSAAA